MLAYVVGEAGDTKGEIQNIEKPKPTKDEEALIRVLRAGVCNTDLEILKGYMGFKGVLGHEFVGIVESVYEEADESWIGKRVCGDINIGCDACGVCNNDRNLDLNCSKMSRNHCPNRTVLGILNKHGTMAEYITLPLRNLHVVPIEISDEEAVFAEPLAAACRIVEQNLVNFSQSDCKYIAILGDGKLGLMIAEVLGREFLSQQKEANSPVCPPPVLFGKHWNKLELVSDCGVLLKDVAECKDADDNILPEYRAKYDVVVDATGSPGGLSLAVGLCRPMGTLVLKSTCAVGEKFNAAPFVIDELRVVGSRCGPIEKALELLSISDSGIIKPLNVKKYITQTFSLEKAQDAIDCANMRKTMKVQIICS